MDRNPNLLEDIELKTLSVATGGAFLEGEEQAEPPPRHAQDR